MATSGKKKAENNLPAPGTILTRKYKGEDVMVEVLAGGFQYNGQVYRSLSAVAREVTGTNWNGKLFFNLKQKAK